MPFLHTKLLPLFLLSVIYSFNLWPDGGATFEASAFATLQNHQERFSQRFLNWKEHGYTVFKNHKNVSFKIASEASYVYISRGQKIVNFGKSNSVTRYQIGWKCKNWKIEMRHFWWFSNNVRISFWFWIV